MAKARQKISIICVNYENRTESEEFLGQFVNVDMSDISILMVDNSEVSKLPNSVCNLNPNTQLISANRNLGYLGAFQFAIDFLAEANQLGDIVVLSNPDIRYSGDFFQKLWNLNIAGATILAPSITSSLSEQDQNPFMIRRPSASRMLFYSYVFRFHATFVFYEILSGLKKEILRFRKVPKRVLPLSEANGIYAPHGSLIVFTKKAIRKFANFKDSPFLFCEEIYLAERAKSLDVEIKYEPGLKAIHKESTTMRLVPSKKISSYKAESNRIVYERYFTNLGTGE